MRKSFILILFLCYSLAQAAMLRGVVVNQDGKPLSYTQVILKSTSYGDYTDTDGRFSIEAPKGEYTLEVINREYALYSKKINIEGDLDLKITLNYRSYNSQEVEVTAASKRVEKITESPSAISTLQSWEIRKKARTNNIPTALEGMTGVDIIRSGASDFSVNTRGFNNNMNRRVLVLQDGRDNQMLLLNAQEWSSFSLPIDEFETIEFIRGPAAALYGANAFNGVLNMKSYQPRDVIGTKVSYTGGDFNTHRFDARHANFITDELSFKATIGFSRVLSFSRNRTPVVTGSESEGDLSTYIPELAYEGLQQERRVLSDDERVTFGNYGTFRMDYDYGNNQKIYGEVGYSNSGGETYAFNLGRVLVTNLHKPYIRAGYNSENLNIQAHYYTRYTNKSDSIWFLHANFYTFNDEDDIMLDAQYNFYADDNEKLHFIVGANYNKQMLHQFNTLTQRVDANFLGTYGQLSWEITDDLKAVVSGRFDAADIVDNFFSPRAALVYEALDNHTFRASFGRSFQRPNYNELFRWSPIAPAFSQNEELSSNGLVDFNKLEQFIQDSISRKYNIDASNLDIGIEPTTDPINGQQQFTNNNLQPISRAYGNENLGLETNTGFEIGYRGSFFEKLFVTFDTYYNRLNNFITVFVPNANEDLQRWEANLTGEFSQYQGEVTDLVHNLLQENSPRAAPLVDIDGTPVMAVSNGNIAEVNQYGFDLGINYYITDELYLDGNWSYFRYDIEREIGDPDIQPNTPTNRVNLGLTYEKKGVWDANIRTQYVQGFDWLAGTVDGFVPEYTLLHLNAGYYIMDNLNVGINIFNLLDREHFQTFGGSELPRYTTFRVTYEF